MKTSKTLCLLFLLFQSSHYAYAEETNELFVTENNPGTAYLGPSVDQHRELQLEVARTNRESLPAKEFPDGNWGEPVSGLQLSLRLDKQSYTNGEKITTILLARSVTNGGVIFAGTSYPNGYAPIGLVAMAADGRHVISRQELWEMTPKSPRISTTISGGVTVVAPKTQQKFLESLNSFYDLTNDTYLVHATVKLPVTTRDSVGNPKLELEEVKSADVRITIEAAPPSSKN